MKLRFTLMTVAALICAATLFDSCCAKTPKKEIALQLYSLRTVTGRAGNVSENFSEIMKKVGQMGYTSVEAACYSDGLIYDRTPEEYRKVIEDAGMQSLSAHVNHYLSKEELESGDLTAALEWWKKCVADHKAAGCKYIVTPSMPKTPTKEEMDVYCRYYNEVGKICKAEGIEYGYHNHSYEFKHKIGDDLMFDYIIKNTDPEYVFIQMDVYWAVVGGVAPVDYFKTYPGRFKSLHIKDHREIGQSGMVGFDAIFRNVKLAGTEFIVVELEKSNNPDIMQGVKESIDYLLKADFVPAKY